MANRDVKMIGNKTIEQSEQVADFIYQRNTSYPELLPKLIKQIMLYTELIISAGATLPDFTENMTTWSECLGKLTQSVEAHDDILTADILHYEIVPAIEKWVESAS